jgi:hypothetical protein
MSTSQGRNTRQLKGWELDRLRTGVEDELKGYAAPPTIDPFTTEPDLLTPAIVSGIAYKIVNTRCSLETAAQFFGLPPDLARDYAEQGNEDLRQCKHTRKAFFAVFMNKAEAAAKLALIKGVEENPLGWLGLSWLLERQWPMHFTANKTQWMAGRQASIADAIHKQLEAARVEKALPLPMYEPGDIIDAE